jgi:hypothetical protein
MWIVTNKGDQACRLLADRHYSRQKPGSPQFCRPGKNLVLKTPNEDAVWVTWTGIRDDGISAWECTIFRNESPILSSELVKAATNLTYEHWGEPPADGLITYVKQEAVKSVNPGYCFLKAGWTKFGYSKRRNLLRLQAPIRAMVL